NRERQHNLLLVEQATIIEEIGEQTIRGVKVILMSPERRTWKIKVKKISRAVKDLMPNDQMRLIITEPSGVTGVQTMGIRLVSRTENELMVKLPQGIEEARGKSFKATLRFMPQWDRFDKEHLAIDRVTKEIFDSKLRPQ